MGRKGRKRNTGQALYVVSHTHWDREWYCTFEEYRFRLVEHTRLLLDILKRDRAYRSFHFDGQTAPLLDYLEVRPQDERELKRRIGEGRIVPGPWFVLADEALTSAESMVANLRLGMAVAKDMGYEGPFCAYVPDQFGHAPQTPQVLSGFGLDTAFMSRGLDRGKWPGTEFVWEGIDGTELFAYFADYTNSQSLHGRQIPGLEVADTEQTIRTYVARSGSGSMILMDGCDHFPPNLTLGEALKALSRKTGFRFVHTTLHDAMEKLKGAVAGKRLSRFKGELRYDLDAGGDVDLNGTLSSRVYLKQYNRKVEALLERWAEPFSAFSLMLGGPHHSEELLQARKTLLLNHPHDSICGCSLDRVHRQMITRFEQAEEIGETVLRRSVADVAACAGKERPPFPPEYPPFRYPSRIKDVDELPLVLANAAPFPVEEACLVPLDLPPRWDAKRIRSEDVAGGAVVVQPIGTRLSEEWGLDRGLRRQETPWRSPACIAVKSTGMVPAYGILSLKLRKGKPGAIGDMTYGRDWMANSFVKVRVRPNASVDIEDRGGNVFRGLNVFEDGGDAGGGYHYQRPAKDKVVSSKGTRARIELIEAGPLFAVLRAALTLKIPAGLSSDFSRRSGPAEPLDIVVYYVLRSGCPFLEIRTVVENRSAGHRLRAVFPSGIRTSSVVADTQFCFFKRPVEGLTYAEQPQGRFVLVPGKKKSPGLAVMNRGLPEYEARIDGTVYLTLMRSFPWMTYQWWPRLATPDGEMKGRWTFEYAVAPAVDAYDAAKKAERFTLPVRPFVLPQEAPEPVLRMSLLELEGAAELSTIERSPYVPGAVEVRVFNPAATRIKAVLKVAVPITKAEKVRLDGKHIDVLKVSNHRQVAVPLKSFEVVTVRLYPTG